MILPTPVVLEVVVAVGVGNSSNRDYNQDCATDARLEVWP